MGNYFREIFEKNMEKNLKNIPEKERLKIIEETNKNADFIIEKMPDPTNDLNFKSKGLIIGRVQSGKTSNFLSLIANSFDKGFDLCFFYAGTNNSLLKQNFERVKKTFKGSEDKLKILNTFDSKYQSFINSEKIVDWVKQGIKVMLVSLKSPQKNNRKHMSKILDLLENNYLSNRPLLIIDDEGDQATLNSLKFQKKGSKISSTYEAATSTIEKSNKVCFLSVTATPQANIFIETADKLSPDFGHIIEPGKGYCGLDVFHGEFQDDYVKEIPEEEEEEIENFEKITKSLEKAIASFFVASAIRKERKDFNPRFMMIHISHLKKVHKILKRKIDTLLNIWKQNLRDVNDTDFKKNLFIFEKEFETFKQEGVKITQSFKYFIKPILELINDCGSSTIINGEEGSFEPDFSISKTFILIGGNILSRGITINGLSTTFISRKAKKSNVDTVEQRARWFGYKNIPGVSDYIDVCRVWASKKIKEDFSLIYEHEEDVWFNLKRSFKEKIPFKEIVRLFILRNTMNSKLRPTRESVAKTKQIGWVGWTTQKYFINDDNNINYNKKLLNDFLKNKSFKIKDFKGVNRHKIYEKLGLQEFSEKVLEKWKFEKDDKVLNKIFSFSFKEKISDSFDLAIMRSEEVVSNNQNISQYQRRKIKEGKIQQLFRGKDIKLNEKNEYDYLGDRNFGGNENVQVQIHFVTDSSKKDIKFSPSIAVFLPDEYAEQYVTQKNY